jgi:hypothetical protein
MIPKPTRPPRDATGGPNTQAWLDYVARQGCLICGKPAELHHIKGIPSDKTGRPLRRRHHLAAMAVIPLCRHHHREGRNSIHQIDEDAFGVNHFSGSKGVLGQLARLALRYIHEGRP